MSELEKLMLNIAFGNAMGLNIGLVIIIIQNWISSRKRNKK